MLVHPSARFIGEVRRSCNQIKGHLPYAHSRGADCRCPGGPADSPSIYRPVAADMVRTSPVALPLAMSKSFQALPWRPLVSSPNDKPALCALQVLFGLEQFKMLSHNYRGCEGGGCTAGRPLDLHGSAAASNFHNDSHAYRLSLGFPEIQGLFQTLMSVCDMSDSVCILLGGWEDSLPARAGTRSVAVQGTPNSDGFRQWMG